MAGLTEQERGLLRAVLRCAGWSGVKAKPGEMPGPGAIPALVGQLAAAQRELCAVARLCERLDRRIAHLEGLLAARPVPAGLTDPERLHVRRLAEEIDRLQRQLDAIDHGPVPYRLATMAEAYLSVTDDLANGMSA